MTSSCSIRKDLPFALRMLQRLTNWGRSCVNQRRRCVYFSQLCFNSYLLERKTLFININNLTNNIRTSSNNKTLTRQMTSNNMMTNKDTLPMTILVTDLVTQNYYWQSLLTYYIVFFFYIYFQFNLMIYFALCFGFMNLSISLITCMC